MQDSFRVAVIEAADDLLEHALRDFLFELAALAHVAEQVTTRGDLDHKEEVLLGLEIFEQAHYVLVASLLQNDDLVQHLAALSIVAKVLLVDALDRDHLTCEVVHGKIDFTEGSFTQNFADSVKVDSCPGYLASALKSGADILADLLSDLLLCCELIVMFD